MRHFLYSVKNNITTILCCCIVFLTLNSCNSKLDNTSETFTKQHDFTSGIEGPATNSLGELFAVNFKEEGTIGKVDKNGTTTLFVKLPNGSIGNGIRFDKEDNMYIADYVNHNILQIKKGSTTPIVYATDSTMNQPNDLAISPNGTLYASDPNWSNNTGNLWMVNNNVFVLLESNMGTTNGIEVNPEGTKLYVNESVQRKIWVYDINKNGAVSNKKLFKTFPDFGLDGMRCDKNGNLFVCRYGKGTVVILSADGKQLKEITLKGKKPTNITFRKNDSKCYVTIADNGNIEIISNKI